MQKGVDRMKPCPFCGSTDLRSEKAAGSFAIYCFSCGATGPDGSPKDVATALWNKRAGRQHVRLTADGVPVGTAGLRKVGRYHEAWGESLAGKPARYTERNTGWLLHYDGNEIGIARTLTSARRIARLAASDGIEAAEDAIL